MSQTQEQSAAAGGRTRGEPVRLKTKRDLDRFSVYALMYTRLFSSIVTHGR